MVPSNLIYSEYICINQIAELNYFLVCYKYILKMRLLYKIALTLIIYRQSHAEEQIVEDDYS